MRMHPRNLKCHVSVLALMTLAACHHAPPPPHVVPPSTAVPPNGYLLVPPPPAAGSEALKRDQQLFNETRKWVGTPRWDLAVVDDDFDLGAVIKDFSCAVGFNIDLTRTPLLNKLMADVSAIEQPRTDAIKTRWARVRPYVGTDAVLCIKDRATKDHNRSYPSGHTVRGNLVAFVLSVLVPDRSDAILARGRIYGESRIVCGAHWSTDVETGYTYAAALAPTILERPEIRAQLPAVRAELQALKQKSNSPDARLCELEKSGNLQDPFRIP